MGYQYSDTLTTQGFWVVYYNGQQREREDVRGVLIHTMMLILEDLL